MLAFLLGLTACGLPDVAHQVPIESSAEPPAALSAPPASAISVSVEDLAPRTLADGLGGTVDASAPVALSLAGGWGGRALDPVLVVGDHRFTEYDFPAPGVLRYTLPERGLLDGGQIRIQWSEEDAIDISAAVQEAL